MARFTVMFVGSKWTANNNNNKNKMTTNYITQSMNVQAEKQENSVSDD